ncbi:MAG: hypothetical protein RO009_01480 [Pseudorhodoplanes sp.]|jgi:hypothetical protein|nr:hypothetical protein [Pseudorhodoplanes sp.]
MKVRRDIASIPVRTAAETWQAIIDLITGTGSVDAATLAAAASVMQSLIADEHPATCPIVVKGSGPRLVVYCLYNEAAMEAGKDVAALTWNPTGGNGWSVTAPSDTDDVTWMNNTLTTRAPRISVHDVASPPHDEDERAESAAQAQPLAINWGVLDQP